MPTPKSPRQTRTSEGSSEAKLRELSQTTGHRVEDRWEKVIVYKSILRWAVNEIDNLRRALGDRR